MELPGAVLRFEWTFDELAEESTRLTQHISLEGPSEEQYSADVEAGFGNNIGPGMEKMAREMARYAERGG